MERTAKDLRELRRLLGRIRDDAGKVEEIARRLSDGGNRPSFQSLAHWADEVAERVRTTSVESLGAARR